MPADISTRRILSTTSELFSELNPSAYLTRRIEYPNHVPLLDRVQVLTIHSRLKSSTNHRASVAWQLAWRRRPLVRSFSTYRFPDSRCIRARSTLDSTSACSSIASATLVKAAAESFRSACSTARESVLFTTRHRPWPTEALKRPHPRGLSFRFNCLPRFQKRSSDA
jgi:hypothetical protein